MSGLHPTHQHSGTCRTSGDGKRDDASLHSPRQNRLLAALPRRAYEHLLPALEPVPLPTGWTVYCAGDRERHLYFLTGGLVSRFYVTEDGASAAFAVTGREGVIGVASFLGGESMPTQAVVLSAGYSYRLGADRLSLEFEHDGPLPQLLLRYTRTLIAETALIAVCNRYHSLDQQLCRWLLSCLDRLPSEELTITQERIAAMLGVRREGVTEAAGRLQRAGLIRCSRGHVTVLDRAGLEAAACKCYAVVKQEPRRLLRRERDVNEAGTRGSRQVVGEAPANIALA
jgi:CRP-like cAMP-binding protein